MSKAANSGLAPAVVAYHEAGHAVASWCLGICVRHATIIPEKASGSAGHVLNGSMGRKTRSDVEWGDRFTRGRLQAEKRAMVSMAGVLAQRRAYPRSVRSHHERSDLNSVVNHLVGYSRPGQDGVTDITPHYTLLQQWTIELLESNWYLVQAVAAALMKHYTLSGKALREVIVTTMDQKCGLEPLVLEKLQSLQNQEDRATLPH